MFRQLKATNLMNKKIKKIFTIPLVRDSLKLSSSNIIMYLVPMIVTPILSRIYDPSMFGDWGIFAGLISIVSVVLFLGYEYAIIKCDNDEIIDVSVLCLISSIIVIIICAIFFIAGFYLQIGFFLEFPNPIWLFIYLIIHSFLTIAQYLANREERYWSMSIGNMLMGGSQAVLRIIFGLVIVFSNGLIAGTVIAHFINLLFFVIIIYPVLKANMHSCASISLREIKDVAKKYKKFPLFDAPSTLLAFAAFNLPIIILSGFYEKSEIGCYSVIIQLLLLPLSFIGAAIGRVYYQRISKKSDYSNIKIETLRTLKIVSYLSVLPALFLSLGGDKILTIFLGDKWEIAGDMSICLAVWSIGTILTQPVLSIYRLLNRQNDMLKYNMAYFIFGIGSITFACYADVELYTTLIIYAICCSLPKFFMFFDIVKLSNNTLKEVYSFKSIAILWLTLVLLAIRILYIIC